MKLDEVLKGLPHAFPFRMIDHILEIEPGERAIAIKNVSVNEPCFSGNPAEPVMPGILILEALAQTGGLAFHVRGEKEIEEGGVPFLAAIDQFRMSKKVVPGDQILLEAEVQHVFSRLAKVKVLARVKGETVAEGMFTLSKGTTEGE